MELTYDDILTWCVQNHAVVSFTSKPQIIAGNPAQIVVEMRIPMKGMAKVAKCPLERGYEPHQALMRALVACVHEFVKDQSKLIIEPGAEMSALLH